MKNLSPTEISRYLDTIAIPEIGLEGQKKLGQSSVLVIGLGGLGSPVALYLSAAGIGRLGLMDRDSVTLSNLQRQILHRTSEIKMFKTESAKKGLVDLNPNVQIKTHQETLNKENASRIIAGYDVIVGCTDNYSSYLLINEVCVLLDKPYVFGAVSQFEGQVSVFYSKIGPCYKCAFSNITPNADDEYSYKGIFCPLPGIIGSIQANECLKLLIGVGKVLISKLLIINSLEMSFHKVQLIKNPKCVVCSK